MRDVAMPAPSRPRESARDGVRWSSSAAAVLLLSCVLAAVLHAPAVLAGGAGVSTAIGLLALRRVGARRLPQERTVLTWSARGLLALLAGFAVEAATPAWTGTTAGAELTGTGFTLGVAAACAFAYQGLVRWNRSRTAVADPADWLNGASSVLGLMALTNFVAEDLPGLAGLAGWELQLHLLRLSCVLVLLGTAATILVLAKLQHDRRAWLLVAALVVVSAAEVQLLLGGGAGSFVVLAAWAGWATAVTVTCVLPPSGPRVAHASSQSTTVGAVVVTLSGVGILVLDTFTPGTHLWSSALAALAALGGSVRVMRLIRDLAQLASTRHEARTDPLTGVANRRGLMEAVDALAAEGGAGLLVLDLDRFKDVNDRFGHMVGDEVIQAMVGRLHDHLGERGLLARLGGDEFAVVLPDPDPDRALRLAHELRTVVSDPVEALGRVLRIEASIGVASTSLGARGDGALLRCADAAMYVAKHTGAGVSLYDEEADTRARLRNDLADELRVLLVEGAGPGVGELELHYQPQLDLRSGDVVGAEALVRWNHPARGLLAPGVFLELAEERGLMPTLTRRVLDEAAREAAAWRGCGHDLRLAVNLSTSCLETSDLLDAIDGALDRASLPADRLVLEITETTLMRDPERAIAATHVIAARGIGISIDDYGTGHSSLSYLNDLPAEELKLDRSFTSRLTSDDRTRAIVSGTIDLAHHLGLWLIAEGVEDEATRVALRDLGCDRTQGYLHSRPLPAGAFRDWLDGADRPVPAVTARRA
ncbi:hypothetical protein AGMMS50218_09230 [Actinomycetota bacterium]|nr:hypothetical protein AGMMS50218_09230 [Actinomycetota bacterium]